MPLSKRATACVVLMKEGAYWRSQLESQYRGSEKFKYRLRSASGQVVPGFGFQTWSELETAGMLRRQECSSSSVWPSEWALKKEETAA